MVPSSCELCDYKTGRVDNLDRHIRLKHGNWQMISLLVADLVDQVAGIAVGNGDGDNLVKEKEAHQKVMENQVGDVWELSEFEIGRNQRIAERQAEFQRRFPNFDQEVASLKVKRKRQPRRKEMTGHPTLGPRKSSRILSRSGEVEEQPDASGIQADAELPGEQQVVAQIAADELPGDAGDLVHFESTDKFRCLPCGMSFRDSGNLKRHVRLKHEVRETAVKCPRTWCKEEFNILAEMDKHRETCRLLCPYAGCSKVFRKQSLFDAHQRAHLIMARRMSDD